MAIINKHGSWKWSATIPLNCGDRYWSQDKIRDFQYLRNLSGDALSRMFYTIPALISGGIVTQTAINTVTISPAIGLVKFSTTIPNTFAAIPPSTTTADVVVLVQSTQQTQLAVTAGSSTNYVKLKYLEADGNTRVRSKKAGTYAYENTDSFQFVINNVSPTAYDLVLASFTNSGGTFTIQQYPCTSLKSGNGSCSIGYEALKKSMNVSNEAFGDYSLSNLISGEDNCAFGDHALYTVVTGEGNCAFGRDALRLSTTSDQCAFGTASLGGCTTGGANSAFGFYSLTSCVSGNDNCAFGYRALESNNYSWNCAFGAFSLQKSIGASNCSFGGNSLPLLEAGNGNCSYGNESMATTTNASENSAYGWYALAACETGLHNCAFGSGALSLAKTSEQCAFGYYALHANATGTGNCAYGNCALIVSTGNDNTATGYNSIGATVSGDYNCAYGYNSLSSPGTKTGNTALGTSSLLSCTTGVYNTAVGSGSAYALTTYSRTTAIGYSAEPGGNNQIQLGTASETTYAYGAIQNESDMRDKTDIVDSDLGLNFINKIKPRRYIFNYREADGKQIEEKKRKRPHYGVIAQEVKSVMDEMKIDFAGYQDSKVNGGSDRLTIGYTEFIAPIIKSIQELSKKVEKLEQGIK